MKLWSNCGIRFDSPCSNNVHQVKAALEKGGKRRTSADLTEFKMTHAKDLLKSKIAV